MGQKCECIMKNSSLKCFLAPLTKFSNEAVITLFQERYGETQMTLDACYAHFMDLAQTSNKTSLFCVVYCTMFR